jgi:zinc transporter ZupT
MSLAVSVANVAADVGSACARSGLCKRLDGLIIATITGGLTVAGGADGWWLWTSSSAKGGTSESDAHVGDNGGSEPI